MDQKVEAAARRYGLSPTAADTLFRALVAGGGHQAQFSHPELGGMGQWSGGMTQVGAMFDDALRAKVGGFCRDVAAVAQRAASGGAARQGISDTAARVASARTGWWPAELGQPASAGSQNGIRYACFPDRRRLVVERAGERTVYDTGPYRLTGFAQQQGGTTSLTFSGPDGAVALDSLTVIRG